MEFESLTFEVLPSNYSNYGNKNIVKNNEFVSNIDSATLENNLFQVLVNEGKHLQILNSKRQQYTYNEKNLRDAAAAEVNALLVHASDSADDQDDIESTDKHKKLLLDPDEKVKLRNREHAKNTRLRKKAYVIKLKELVDQLTLQKDIEAREQKLLAEKVYNTQVIRRNTVRLFMMYRTGFVTELTRWSNILADDVILTQPITPYRSFCRGDINHSTRVTRGIPAVIADVSSLALMTENIGINKDSWKYRILDEENVMLDCLIDFNENDTRTVNDQFIVGGDIVMCKYILTPAPQNPTKKNSYLSNVDCGNNNIDENFIQHGMIRCKFNKKNKIYSIEIVFDVMGFMQQLQRVSNINPENNIVPNTLDMAVQPCTEARAIVRAQSPYPILHVNDSWTLLSGQTQYDIEGCDFMEAMHMHADFKDHLSRLLEDCGKLGRPGSRIILLSNHLRHSIPNAYSLFYISMIPLTTDLETRPTHIQVNLVLLNSNATKIKSNLLQQYKSYSFGPVATSANNKQLQRMKEIFVFEQSYIRQCQAFLSCYSTNTDALHVSTLTGGISRDVNQNKAEKRKKKIYQKNESIMNLDFTNANTNNNTNTPANGISVLSRGPELNKNKKAFPALVNEKLQNFDDFKFDEEELHIE